ncbi:hypothetical protein EQG64_00575 [Streptomyces sp. S6]|nr:hypothetical protein EQG64_00575 [Streptomyces sp. S6]
MSSADSIEAPIYAGLVEEQGDVPAEVRRVAEEVLRDADRAVDFGATAVRRRPLGPAVAAMGMSITRR